MKVIDGDFLIKPERPRWQASNLTLVKHASPVQGRGLGIDLGDLFHGRPAIGIFV